ESELLYQAGIGHAAQSWDSHHCARLIYMAFPFETLVGDEIRQMMMDRVLDFLVHCGPQRVAFAAATYRGFEGSGEAIIDVVLDVKLIM
ncbi:MAG: hypothetical protein GY759_21125, partial [Chloroflexi bacterium]|nr:hypothetical protein [Chloroflexota bacterium]